ncbi:MAG: hypothetical protein JRJ66_02915 [Deltaproteobacteria bacterium]|nr:hypothetical protein [Deltaproteobacteria bacterium]
MPFLDELKVHLETQERETVGSAFGAPGGARRTSYSITTIRDWILGHIPFQGQTPIEQCLRRADNAFPRRVLRIVVGNLIRFSFLIELTNITIGSTKMKTRWIPGLILMPQPNSFEPIQGSFEPGNDPRASSFDECVSIFTTACNTLCDEVLNDPALINFIEELNRHRRVPYEFPFVYSDPAAEPVHTAANISWTITDDLRWLLKARKILDNSPEKHKPALNEIKKSKIQVKIYKTDRALTGKDKTNRAKRWEVLAGDFQHATLPQCWSSEKKITYDLVLFDGFPEVIKNTFIEQGLITGNEPVTRCPVTLEPLNYTQLARAVLNYTHGVSDYQIGHLYPLKRGGIHDGTNVCWQSADGNRIQGHLTIEETRQLLREIEERRQELA